MDYHKEILKHPYSHGIRVDRFKASDGTPVLVVSPSGRPGKRGRILREQLEERNVPLPEFGSIRASLVLLHGRMGRKEDFLPIAERFCACGFRCIIPDLHAHGEHPETFATYGQREQSIPAHVLSEAAEEFQFSPSPAGLFGISMGGSVAIHAASRADGQWRTLIAISSFDSLAKTVEGELAARIGSPLAARLFPSINEEYRRITSHSLDEINPLSLAPSIRTPVLVAHGTADELIPLTSSRSLFRSFPDHPRNHWIKIPDGDHNNALITPYLIYAEMVEWMIPEYQNPPESP